MNKENKKFSMRLFITGDAPNSRIAKENVRILKKRLSEYDFHLEIVDVMENPDAALEHGIYVTPALQVIKPEPGTLIFGNLSNHNALEKFFPERFNE